MRLLWVSAAPFPGTTGTQVYVGTLARALVRAGHQLTLCSYGPSNGVAPPDIIGQVWPGTSGPVRTHQSEQTPGPAMARLLTDIRLMSGVARYLRKHPIDLIHAHHLPALLAVLPTARRMGIPVVYAAHTDIVAELPLWFPRVVFQPYGSRVELGLGPLSKRISRQLGVIESQALRHCCGWTATDPQLASIIDDRAKGQLPGAIVMPALDPSDPVINDAHLDREPGSVAWTGSFDRFQGLDELATIWTEVSEQNKTASLKLVTHDRRPVPRCLRLRGVVVTRVTSWRQAMEALGKASICIVPRTLQGGMPVKFFSAMALGQAVVTTRNAATGLLRDGVNGRVVEGTPKALARALRQLLNQPQTVARLGRAARQDAVDRHLATHRVPLIEDLYRRARRDCR